MFYISEKTSIVWFSIFTSNTAKVEYILPPCIWKPQTEALVLYIWVSLLANTAIGMIYIRTKFLWKNPMEAHGSFQWHEKETFTFNCEMITGFMLM